MRIIILEDHYGMYRGYRSLLGELFPNALIEWVATIDDFSAKISSNIYEMIFLDIILSTNNTTITLVDEDLGFIKKFQPKTKVVVISSVSEGILIYEIIKKINPHGFLNKAEITDAVFKKALLDIQRGNRFFCRLTEKRYKDLLNEKEFLDDLNRKIITLLSQGVKTKNLPNYIDLSLSAIDKRKTQIKNFFGIDKGTDEDILINARKNGYI